MGYWVLESMGYRFPTNFVAQKFYGVWESMGYLGYGLRGCRL